MHTIGLWLSTVTAQLRSLVTIAHLTGTRKILCQTIAGFVPSRFCRELCNRGLSWNFILACSNHVNDIVQHFMLHVLQALLGCEWICCPTCKEFRTMLKEVKAILNNRPLVSTHDDMTNHNVITPMSLLVPCLPPDRFLGPPEIFVGSVGAWTAFHHVQHRAEKF